MTHKKLWMIAMAGALLATSFACSSKSKPVPLTVLDAPPQTTSQAMVFMKKGNELYRAGNYDAARQEFQAAVKEQKDLAEAHYNLALTLDRMGDDPGAKKHYIEAANLAPGHKVIWNSPPLRRYGNVPDKPPEATATPVLPGFGGGARPGGGAGL